MSKERETAGHRKKGHLTAVCSGPSRCKQLHQPRSRRLPSIRGASNKSELRGWQVSASQNTEKSARHVDLGQNEWTSIAAIGVMLDLVVGGWWYRHEGRLAAVGMGDVDSSSISDAGAKS